VEQRWQRSRSNYLDSTTWKQEVAEIVKHPKLVTKHVYGKEFFIFSNRWTCPPLIAQIASGIANKAAIKSTVSRKKQQLSQSR
jgi:hypothetical protein